MKYNCKEYEQMVTQLNLNKSKLIRNISFIIIIVLCFLVNYIEDKEFWYDLIFALGVGMIFCFFFRRAIIKNAKKINLSNKIVSVEQEIDEEKIKVKIIKEGNIENTGEYKYEDIIKMKEDKFNFYLYITSTAAVIVSKKELEKTDEFRQRVLEKMKKEKIS